MKNKKLIGVVIVILIITVGVISWMFAKKSQQLPIQIQKEVTAQPIASVQQIQPEAQAIPSDETVNWQTYKNERFGFELKTPTGLESQYIETNFGVGKQKVLYIAIGDPEIDIVTNVVNLSKDVYGNYSPYATEPKVILNGITWYIFYSPEGGAKKCDSAKFQTFMPNRKDAISISALVDTNHCPGNPNQSSTVAKLKQILSTFKFTK